MGARLLGEGRRHKDSLSIGEEAYSTGPGRAGTVEGRDKERVGANTTAEGQMEGACIEYEPSSSIASHVLE